MANDRTFDGQVALVTGGTRGIGQAIAEALHARGAIVALCSRDAGDAQAAAEALDPSGETALGLCCDVSDEDRVRRMIGAILERFGRLTLAVNNAGGPGEGPVPLTSKSVETWNRVIAANLTGTFLCLKHEIPAIEGCGGGAIVNLASANGLVGFGGLSDYTAAKHGLIGLTREAALDCADKNIRVNAVAPGFVDTPALRDLPDPVRAEMAGLHPLGRMARRAEVAEMALFLLSEASGFSTGGVFPVDGGYTSR